jgi:hypothetical protein
MTTRLEKFRALRTHAMYGKLFKRLRADDVTFCELFIRDNENLDTGDYRLKINRAFLDSKTKPKAWTEICDLLDASK